MTNVEIIQKSYSFCGNQDEGGKVLKCYVVKLVGDYPKLKIRAKSVNESLAVVREMYPGSKRLRSIELSDSFKKKIRKGGLLKLVPVFEI